MNTDGACAPQGRTHSATKTSHDAGSSCMMAQPSLPETLDAKATNSICWLGLRLGLGFSPPSNKLGVWARQHNQSF